MLLATNYAKNYAGIIGVGLSYSPFEIFNFLLHCIVNLLLSSIYGLHTKLGLDHQGCTKVTILHDSQVSNTQSCTKSSLYRENSLNVNHKSLLKY